MFAKYLKYKKKYLMLKEEMIKQEGGASASTNKNVYFTHDNGSRPFKVVIKKGMVNVYKRKREDEYETKPILTYETKRIFIGASPHIDMTEYSGGYGPKFNGNSLLLQVGMGTGMCEYVHIGSEIFSFSTKCEIKKYVSPVGNNDVPYPYAIDLHGNYYLLIEEVVILAGATTKEQMKEYDDPYTYYYDYNLITEDAGTIPKTEPKIEHFGGIVRYMIGSNKYTLRYNPNAKKEYDRIMRSFNNKPMYIINVDKKKIELTKRSYIKLMKDYGRALSFEPMQHLKIHQVRI